MRYLIEKRSSVGADEKKVIEYLDKHELPFELFTPKQIERGKVNITHDCVVFGGLKSINMALKLIGIKKPTPNNYPKELLKYYERQIWNQTLERAVTDQRDGKDYFIKPKDDFKSFAGFRLQEADGVNKIRKAINKHGLSYSIECSEVVNFVSEYRVYILNGRVGFISHYWGERQDINASVVEQIVSDLTSGGQFLNTILDVGILDTGKIAVVEHNAAFSVDSYECPSDVYAQILLNGWMALIAEPNNTKVPCE